MYIQYNANPLKNIVGDCVIRAISKVMDKSWDDVYGELALQGFMLKDMPSSNEVWGSYLQDNGFTRHIIPNTCPACYTVEDFCIDFPQGKFVLGTGTHAIASIDGCYYDTWQSGNESLIYYWEKEKY